MARPKTEHPTPAELEVLKILWDRGPSTVREVLDVLNQRRLQRAYTSVMSLMNVMADKGLLVRQAKGRAFLYHPRVRQDATLAHMVGDLWKRAFEESASTMVTHLLEEANPTERELDEIRKALDAYEQQQGTD